MSEKGKHGGLEVSEAKRLRAQEDENGKLKQLPADAMLGQCGVERPAVKEVVSAAAKRESVARLRAWFGMSERRACPVIGADRTSMCYRPCPDGDEDLRSRLRELVGQRRRFGYRRLHILLRRDSGAHLSVIH